MLTFEIHGKPVAQKQTRFSTQNGKTHAYDPSSIDKTNIQWQIKPFAPPEPLKENIELSLTFFLPIPQNISGRKRKQMINRIILPGKKPDVDNLAYIVTNALKNIVYKDDSQICAFHAYKFYGEIPKTIIRVRPILEIESILDDIELI